MSWLLRLMLASGALIALACGESSAPGAGESVTELTVLLPSGPEERTTLHSFITSFEYEIRCDSTTLDGTLSKVDAFDWPSKGRTAVWRGALSPPAESCDVVFIGRDDDGEAICPFRAPLPAPSEWPSELFFEAPCYRFYCTSTPLPDTVRKSCFSIVGLLLSAQLPAALEVDRVEYAISSLDGIDPVYRGELDAADLGQADFGQGATPTVRWETAIENVPAKFYLVEMTAFDSENTPLCSAERQLHVLPDAIAQVEITMPCSTAEEGLP